MVKLTPELIESCRQFINPLKDRELSLRGFKVPAIENLGATMDQFDTIDLSENDIRKLDGFPLLRRLKHILINNNRVCRITEKLGENLPNLQSLIMSNNNVQELGDLDPLASCPNLEFLSLMGNPVANKPQYRMYVIYRIPQLRVVDFRRIKDAERQCAKDLFKGKKGKSFQARIVKHSRVFVPGHLPETGAVEAPSAVVPGGKPVAGSQAIPARRLAGLTQEEINSIKEAIANATSLEEVERLNQILQAGHIPGELFGKRGAKNAPPVTQNGNEEEQDEDEEMEEDANVDPEPSGLQTNNRNSYG